MAPQRLTLVLLAALVVGGGVAWGPALLRAAVSEGAAAPPAPPPPKPVRLAPEGGLTFDVRDAKTGEGIPCKVTLLGVAGSRDPELTRTDIGRPEGDSAIAAYNRIMSTTGSGAAHVPFGTYDVTISRGPEWDIATLRKVKIGPAGAVVTARLSHVVDTHEWLSADFHVHAARSPDSRVPMQDRIFEFVADDVQMIVATDHNVVSDYEPYIRELGVGKYIASATGDELTTDFEVPTDSYVVVRVDGERPLSPVVGDRKTFTAYPFALTNPVFLDVDGDGV